MCKQPIQQSGCDAYLVLDVMSFIGKLGAFGMTACFFHSSDHIPAATYRYVPVMLTVESPYRYMYRFGRQRWVTTATNGYGGKQVRTGTDEIPCAIPASGNVSYVAFFCTYSIPCIQRFNNGIHQGVCSRVTWNTAPVSINRPEVLEMAKISRSTYH